MVGIVHTGTVPFLDCDALTCSWVKVNKIISAYPKTNFSGLHKMRLYHCLQSKWIVKETGNKKVLWSAVQGGLTRYKRATWHLHVFLYIRTGKRIELPGNVALWFLYWSGCICATCWWHDWSISSPSAFALLITLLNIATGEALLEAAVTSPEQWCTLAPPFSPFFRH